MGDLKQLVGLSPLLLFTLGLLKCIFDETTTQRPSGLQIIDLHSGIFGIFGRLRPRPPTAARLLYSLISGFGHNPQFTLINGDSTIHIVMVIVEEVLVVCLYTVLRLMTPRSSVLPQMVGGGVLPERLSSLSHEAREDGGQQQQPLKP
ncbi:uncharacterized protein BO72DRAFT_507916 [Aspergillus fijiensis CBS 313.89]|uniref:DUF7702 domain-containing protein n=1 Tax=Aspergillus fijiensis CBS 313.89 TaxID=1448319 RepID=A0A8G1W079_9EURO|nr:uncharacterized protein BO72DRAFT_507916 [Aspergillus fijiensis CBS 313.89]RAK78061.1 hypothetical protein BO72DRAFT_507916 [Aspergillus fijiensis CBS 313.89]